MRAGKGIHSASCVLRPTTTCARRIFFLNDVSTGDDASIVTGKSKRTSARSTISSSSDDGYMKGVVVEFCIFTDRSAFKCDDQNHWTPASQTLINAYPLKKRQKYVHISALRSAYSSSKLRNKPGRSSKPAADVITTPTRYTLTPFPFAENFPIAADVIARPGSRTPISAFACRAESKTSPASSAISTTRTILASCLIFSVMAATSSNEPEVTTATSTACRLSVVSSFASAFRRSRWRSTSTRSWPLDAR